MTARIRKVLASTKFVDAPFVALSAAPGGTGKLGAAAPVLSDTSGVKAQSDTVATLVETMKSRVQLPERTGAGPFLFAVDHCFPIKGQGTVLTGTVLSGSCRINDSIELPELRVEKKVKSMQMFKKAVSCIRQGDRAGICVAGLDPELMERGIACTPGSGEYTHSHSGVHFAVGCSNSRTTAQHTKRTQLHCEGNAPAPICCIKLPHPRL